MPHLSDRQKHANALLEAFILQTILEAQESASIHDTNSTGSDWNTDSEKDQNSDDGSSASTDWDIDVEEDESRVSNLVILACHRLYQNFYIEERRKIPKTCENLNMLLTEYKASFPDIFRSYLRITPECFDSLLESIQHHEAFQNNSNNGQMPLERQLAIALYRFGHFGNGVSTLKVALWAGVGYGTVRDCTNRVMHACCDERFRRVVMQWPSDEEIEEAKDWVEANSCPAWRDGWLMVDGTLIPMFQRPHHFGSAYFDRKSNYSENVQIINTPDLRIVDYGIGLPGSQHDATAWQHTRLPQEHQRLLKGTEFVWADSAYPVRTWCQAPYKDPEKSREENTEYNYYVSRVRIRSEHCMGYLKGRWSSLRGLRLRIDHRNSKEITSIWIMTCIHLYNFAMAHERGTNVEADLFFVEGQRLMRKEREERIAWERHRAEALTVEEAGYGDGSDEAINLLAGRIKREKLKQALFVYLRQE